jgi:hypothetical protein
MQTIQSDLPIANLPIANLSNVLKKGLEAFPTAHEKMIFLYGGITVLSGLTFRVKGEYHRRILRPNLFLFVLAPPASGKGALNYAGKLIDGVHQAVLDASNEAIHTYNIARNSAIATNNHVNRPSRMVVRIPANSSNAKLIEHLMANNEKAPAIMVESEIDTLSYANKADWGNYSDIFRRVFQNEDVSYSRKLNDEYFEVKAPRMSVALAGTLNQFRKLVTNSEDGLYSRFLVYEFSAPPQWSDVAPCDACINLDDLFKGLSDEVKALYDFLDKREITVALSKQQWDRLNDFGNENTTLSFESGENTAPAYIRRHALMLFKICMTLTALKAAERKDESSVIICDDNDFALALKMAELSLENTMQLLKTLPAVSSSPQIDRNDFFSALPLEFDRAKAIHIAHSLGIAMRTADRILQELIDSGALNSVERGKYKK